MSFRTIVCQNYLTNYDFIKHTVRRNFRFEAFREKKFLVWTNRFLSSEEIFGTDKWGIIRKKFLVLTNEAFKEGIFLFGQIRHLKGEIFSSGK